MLRCASSALLGALAIMLAPAAQAQLARPFPSNALRGELVVTQPPEVLLNGQPARLSPGSRIRAQNNMLQLSGGLVGQKLVVNYTLDPLGLVHNVWILTDDEKARQPWPTTAEQAQQWRFDAGAQTWTKP